MRSRAEHLQWAKDRALAYLKPADSSATTTRLGMTRFASEYLSARPEPVSPKQLSDACASFLSDITKHPEIDPQVAQMVFAMEAFSGGMNTEQKVRAFIEGTN